MGLLLDDTLKPKGIDAVQKRMLIQEMRVATHMEEERIGAIVEGAILGAEQVQDIRIMLLENPETSTLEITLTILFTLALESTLAGKLSTLFARGVLKRWAEKTAVRISTYNKNNKTMVEMNKVRYEAMRIKDNALAQKGSKGGRRKKGSGSTGQKGELKDDSLNKVVRDADKIIEEAWTEIEKAIKSTDDAKSSSIWSFLDQHVSFIQKVLDNTVYSDQNTAAVLKTIVAGLKAQNNPSTPAGRMLDRPSSSGVGFVTEMYEWAASCRVALRAAHELHEMMIDVLDISEEDAQKTRASFGHYYLSDIAYLRQEMMLFSEAVIWARLYDGQLGEEKTGWGGAGQGGTLTSHDSPIPPKLQEYLAARFRQAAYKHTLGIVTDINVYPKWENMNLDEKFRRVRQYFTDINKKAGPLVAEQKRKQNELLSSP